jgi:Sulfatase
MFNQLRIYLQTKKSFLVFLPILFIAHGHNHYFGFFSLSFIITNLLLSIVLTAFIYQLTVSLLKDKNKSSLFSFFLLLFLFTFGALHDTLKQIVPVKFFSSYRFILPLSFLLMVIVFVMLKRKKKVSFSGLFLYLNTVCLCLLLYEAGDAVINYKKYKEGSALIDPDFKVFNQYRTNQSVQDSLKPDIFFLLFDAMPSTKAMKETWRYNNSMLDSFLLKEQFFISQKSKSNYNLTVLSVSSTFTMNYLPSIDTTGDEIKMYFKASASILHNSFTKILRKEGYTIKQYQPISFNNTDWEGGLFFEQMLQMNYFYQTFPGRIYRDLWWNVSRLSTNKKKRQSFLEFENRNTKAEKELYETINLVKNICSVKSKQPKMVYAHFMLPHDPYIFDSSGKRKSAHLTFNIKEEDQPKAFIQQVQFANQIIKNLVTEIKTRNKKNTIIIVEGDHGFRNILGKKGYMIFENLNALYFPDQNYQMLYDSVSPINSFRIILNNFFSANLPLLKDSSIFIPYTLPGPEK